MYVDLYRTSTFIVTHPLDAQVWITQFTCKLQIYHACLCLVSIHQTAPPLIAVADI